MFNNKKILVTGGTGYFGKKFTKHIFKYYKPKSLIIFQEMKPNSMKCSKIFQKKNIKV